MVLLSPQVGLDAPHVVENLCMRPNIGPADAGPARPVATAL